MISIVGTQAVRDEEPEKIELMTEGRMVEKNGKYYLSYDETAITGFGEGTTTLKMDGGQVTMLRQGVAESRMTFEEKETHIGKYQTPFGLLVMGARTKELRCRPGKSGSLYIEYTLDMDNIPISEHTLGVSWTEKEGTIE